MNVNLNFVPPQPQRPRIEPGGCRSAPHRTVPWRAVPCLGVPACVMTVSCPLWLEVLKQAMHWMHVGSTPHVRHWNAGSPRLNMYPHTPAVGLGLFAVLLCLVWFGLVWFMRLVCAFVCLCGRAGARGRRNGHRKADETSQKGIYAHAARGETGNATSNYRDATRCEAKRDCVHAMPRITRPRALFKMIQFGHHSLSYLLPRAHRHRHHTVLVTVIGSDRGDDGGERASEARTHVPEDDLLLWAWSCSSTANHVSGSAPSSSASSHAVTHCSPPFACSAARSLAAEGAFTAAPPTLASSPWEVTGA